MTNQPIEQLPTREIKLPVENVTIINVDELKPNSVILINIDVNTPAQKNAVSPSFAKLFSPYSKELKEKNISIMLLSLKETIKSISEEEMNSDGWFKKEKSAIINPYDIR